MADQKLTALDAATTLGDADLVYVVDDVAGTPTSKKLTGADLFAGKVQSADVTDIAVVTQAAYDALSPADPDTLYVVVG